MTRRERADMRETNIIIACCAFVAGFFFAAVCSYYSGV